MKEQAREYFVKLAKAAEMTLPANKSILPADVFFPNPKRTAAALISNDRKTIRRVIEATKSGEIPEENIACIISTSPIPSVVREHAKTSGLPQEKIKVINPFDFRSGGGNMVDYDEFTKNILQTLKEVNATDVVINDHRISRVPQDAFGQFGGEIFNQHRGPLPETRGMCGRQAIAAGWHLANRTGNMTTEVVLHRINGTFRHEEKYRSDVVKVSAGDTVSTLQRRALSVGREQLVDFLKGVASEEVKEIPYKPKLLTQEQRDLVLSARAAAKQLYPRG
jgi:folate-dependent phosphoribosylglycinamide formyltransferase PurN